MKKHKWFQIMIIIKIKSILSSWIRTKSRYVKNKPKRKVVVFLTRLRVFGDGGDRRWNRWRISGFFWFPAPSPDFEEERECGEGGRHHGRRRWRQDMSFINFGVGFWFWFSCGGAGKERGRRKRKGMAVGR